MPDDNQMDQGNQQQQQQQPVDPRVQKIREKAAFDAANFEQRYTSQQKNEIARIDKAKQDLSNNPSFSEEEKKRGMEMLDNQNIQIHPGQLPKLDPFPKGQGSGAVWQDKSSGALISRRGGDPHVLVRPDQSLPYLYAKAKQELDLTQLNHKYGDQTATRGLLSEHLFETTTDADGNEMRRQRSPEELQALAQAANGVSQKKNSLGVDVSGTGQHLELQGEDIGANEMPGGGKWKPGELTHVIPTPGYDEETGWGHKESDSKEDRDFLIRHGNDPHAQDKLDEFRQHRQDKRDMMRHQREMESIQSGRLEKQQEHERRMGWQAHKNELMKARNSYRTIKTPDASAPGGYKVTQRGHRAIDKMMVDEFGETGLETYQQYKKKMEQGEEEPESNPEPKPTTQPQQSSQQTVPMPKSAQWHRIKSAEEWNRLPSGSYVILPDGRKKRKP